MYGPKNGRVATDPRPINDRAFMNQAIRSLIEYLSEHNFNSAISPKILTRPTTKQFQDIVLFLLRQVDPNFQVSQKFENDITVMLRGLGYAAAAAPPWPLPRLTAGACVSGPQLPLRHFQVLAHGGGQPAHVAVAAGLPELGRGAADGAHERGGPCCERPWRR